MPEPGGVWQLGPRRVNRVGFGAMRLASASAFGLGPSRDRAASIAVLRRARDLGVNHFDTAAFYFSPLRSANELIDAAFPDHDDDLVVATKVGPARTPSGEWADQARPDQLRGQVEENLRQLGRDRLDLVYLRAFGPGSIAERFGALAELQSEGLIASLGISNVSSEQLAEARGVASVVSVQNRFGLDHRTPQTLDLLAETTRLGIAFVPYFAMAGASGERGRSGEANDANDAVAAVAVAHGASVAQIRLAWTLHQAPNVLAIPGTGDMSHLEQNVEAAEISFTHDELSLLGNS
ncbi:aldo/keto reductase [Humibacter sp. RRB41]|uniref:aldo/keto reductase n=1 Tax=Humibacter sp. RRB41 TaxID=2919946 RepID=UPI001FAA3EFF|nr:aldo/keto reductase [Humibacter sp. RRB41]